MLTRRKSILLSALTIAAIYIFVYYLLGNRTLTPSQVVVLPSPSPVSSPTSQCLSVNDLPDSRCTPGAINPNVKQENIHETICTKGYTKTIRPPVSYTNRLKLVQMETYGYKDNNPSDFEEDHLIPLELGGAPDDPKNLWPELGGVPNDKDKVENLCNYKVCQGIINLQEAQQQIAKDWHIACK